jgi:hypothetical protein
LCGGFGGFDGDLSGAVLLAFLKADIVLDEEMDEFCLVVFGEVGKLNGFGVLFLSHYLYTTNGQYKKD